MTLAETLQPKLGSWKPAGDGRHSWSAAFPDAGWSVALSADHNDVVGSLVWELAVTRLGDAPAGLTLKQWATGIADRASGLMEDLTLHEVDDARQEAILRSDEPSRKGETVAYYEVRLSGLGRAVVRRFSANRTGGRREQVTFPVTHEALAKLVGDIAE